MKRRLDNSGKSRDKAPSPRRAAQRRFCVGFLRHAALMLYGEPSGEIPVGEHNSLTLIPLFVILAVLIVLSLYLPAPIAKLVGEASLLVNGNAH